ncbi:GNAT family N-acetyltransferase [Cytobacillus firmus]|uniref:Acetyltransferase n=1 Tax=Cytobacillus firmus TaxID=1399 RepID=A0A380XTI6_CYTFI|nr:GNAT family N-acetyltransferase [Cytobacillus firmus]KAF0822641.1 Acetyltransferase [Cytobacillus firmus]MBG9543749.1 acetyltransferase [Cytobacillus firmus]MBG9546755.1 acetyltransferase [Cytobacillus firmus]MBG9553237.1 acetyltransferase [Cytobacillus firmus]MBG9556871.1 acetyltransferase [Cytobacillus firmus]
MNLVMKSDLAERLDQAETDVLYSRLTAIQHRYGNPMGVEIKRIGQTTAFFARNIPGPSFNLVKGFKEADAEVLDQIVEFYQGKGIPIRLEITPSNGSSDLLKMLHQKGFYQCNFHTTLFAEPSDLKDLPIHAGIDIRRMQRKEFDLFGEVYTKGFGMPGFLSQGIAENNEVLYDNNEKWVFYLAFVNTEPAGIGVIFMEKGVANLAAAAVVPSFRNRGVHSALIQARISQAITNNAELVTGQARFGSASQNNMEKAGLKIGYTKAIWIRE